MKRRTKTATSDRICHIRDDGYYYVVATRLYRLAITNLDRCAILSLITRLLPIMRSHSWMHVAAELQITLIAAGVAQQDIARIYRSS